MPENLPLQPHVCLHLNAPLIEQTQAGFKQMVDRGLIGDSGKKAHGG